MNECLAIRQTGSVAGDGMDRAGGYYNPLYCVDNGYILPESGRMEFILRPLNCVYAHLCPGARSNDFPFWEDDGSCGE